MRRICKFFGFALIAVSILGCQIPSTVKVEGNPELVFAANMDFSDVFSDMMGDGFGESENGIILLDAINSPSLYKTFVVQMELFNEEIESPIDSKIVIGGQEIDISGKNINTTQDVELFNTATGGNAISLPLDGFGDYLEGFKVNTTDIQARLYFNGSRVVEKLTMDMQIGGENLGSKRPILGSSGIDPDAENYEGTELLDKGIDITDEMKRILENPENTDLDVRAYFAAGELISVDELQDTSLSAELVIWFPLEFVAGGDITVEGIGTGAKITVPELEDAGTAITDLAESEIIESMDIELGLTENHPFAGAWLIIEDENNPSFVIANQAGGSTINFGLTKSEIDRINDSPNYSPKLSIFFENGKSLGVPETLEINEIRINAKIGTYIIGGED